MITIDSLKAFGADTESGIKRCMNKESFFIRMVSLGMSDKNFENLKQHTEEGNLKAAFDDAHALKGAIGNLSLTPLYQELCEITELLRAGKQMDYAPQVSRILAMRDKIIAM